MTHSVHIIIVTHNSADVLPSCLNHLSRQSAAITSIIIVDSGSDDTEYLQDLSEQNSQVRLINCDNIGFAKANNIGFAEIAFNKGVVVFINPDTFLPPEYISNSLEIINENGSAAIVSGKLLGFDAKRGEATGKIDSTGIFRKWYGRWYDRGNGEEHGNSYGQAENVPAVCGALMVCRLEALLPYGGEVFDSDFFLYKEDIELSLRLQRDGWRLIYDPRLVAYHCRGWQKKRKSMPLKLRLMAAKNEVLLYRKHPSIYILWAFFKYLLIVVFRL